jgi:hypothetical protein
MRRKNATKRFWKRILQVIMKSQRLPTTSRRTPSVKIFDVSGRLHQFDTFNKLVRWRRSILNSSQAQPSVFCLLPAPFA